MFWEKPWTMLIGLVWWLSYEVWNCHHCHLGQHWPYTVYPQHDLTQKKFKFSSVKIFRGLFHYMFQLVIWIFMGQLSSALSHEQFSTLSVTFCVPWPGYTIITNFCKHYVQLISADVQIYVEYVPSVISCQQWPNTVLMQSISQAIVIGETRYSYLIVIIIVNTVAW